MKITCIHQGYELYGSDRTFLSCVDFLKELFPQASITVILPKEGELSRVMRSHGYVVETRDLWVLRKSHGTLGLVLRALRFPAFVWKALAVMRYSDLIYINTSVIFDFIVAARGLRRKTIIHVHEIPGSKVRWLFRGLLAFAGCPTLFNSEATRNSLTIPAAIPQAVVYNGVDVVAATPHGGDVASHNRLRLLMIGRINAWKGQDLLVEAVASLLPEQRAHLEIRIVGDVFEGAPFRDRLLAQIEALAVTRQFDLRGFNANPSSEYLWSDIVIVPSREPEPFGLVAIEAMGHGKPVIAADHGGLAEIVVEGTGWRFCPNDPADLAAKIGLALMMRDDLVQLGAQGLDRYRRLFTLNAFRQNFQSAVTRLVC